MTESECVQTNSRRYAVEENPVREGPREPDARACAWTDCTDFVGADTTQIRVFAGSGCTICITALPGCDSVSLTYALLQQRDETEARCSWIVDLRMLETFDRHFPGALIAIGKHLQRNGGRLTLLNFDRASVRSNVPNWFFEECAVAGTNFGVTKEVEQRLPKTDQSAVMNPFFDAAFRASREGLALGAVY